MTLTATPPITLQAVLAEFGAPANTPLSAFVRGGSYVPNTGMNAGVPTALPISLLQLLGAGATPALLVNITSHAVNALRSGAGTCSAVYSLLSSGVAQYALNGGGGVAFSGEWLLSGAASSYEVRYTHTSGSAPSLTGTSYGTWTAMNNTTSASRVQGAGTGATGGSVLVEIRPAGGGATLSTATIDLSAERF